MCLVGLNTFKLGIVNSPMWAAAKKVVVRQAKVVMCSGIVKSRWLQMAAMAPTVYGSLGGRFKVGGVRLWAAL